jgi:hypothetical protein
LTQLRQNFWLFKRCSRCKKEYYIDQLDKWEDYGKKYDKPILCKNCQKSWNKVWERQFGDATGVVGQSDKVTKMFDDFMESKDTFIFR